MATVQDPPIEELSRQSARIEVEMRKLMAEANKLPAERPKLDGGRALMPRPMIFRAMLAAALLGAGAAIAKLFFSDRSIR